jgi:hypothetical protein
MSGLVRSLVRCCDQGTDQADQAASQNRSERCQKSSMKQRNRPRQGDPRRIGVITFFRTHFPAKGSLRFYPKCGLP